MLPIQELAHDLGAEERTLRRAAAQGTLRARRTRPRRLRLAAGEREYLHGHWSLLAELRKALRTQRDARLVVLYGSLARGDEDADSDLDLMVASAGKQSPDVRSLAARMEEVAGRRADVAELERIEEAAPLLLDRVLDEGRVLIDRDGQWQDLRGRRPAIRARAQRAHRRQMGAAMRAVEELTGE